MNNEKSVIGKWCLELAVFIITDGGNNDGNTNGLSVLWPSWSVLPAMICVVLRSSSFPEESKSSKLPKWYLLPSLLLFFFFPFVIGFFRGFRSVFFTKILGVVFATMSNSGPKKELVRYTIIRYIVQMSNFYINTDCYTFIDDII